MEINGIIIEPQSGSAGTHDISVSIAAVNEGIDKVVEFDGVCGDASARLTITHEGLRQRYITADGKVFCVAGGGRYGVLKRKQKKVNQLRWAIISGGKVGGRLVNADTLDGNGSWDYPVTSDVTILLNLMEDGDVSEALFHQFSAGEQGVNVMKYIPDATILSTRCEPAEDDNYIYEVTITDLR